MSGGGGGGGGRNMARGGGGRGAGRVGQPLFQEGKIFMCRGMELFR